jgi:hypothetical protein
LGWTISAFSTEARRCPRAAIWSRLMARLGSQCSARTLLEIGVELAARDPDYSEMVTKFVDHFLWIARAMNKMGPDGMWDEEDGFYYDVLRHPDGRATRLKVRSMVGLLPLCATTVIEPWQRERVPGVTAMFQERLRRMPRLLESIHPTGQGHRGVADRGIFALVNPERLRRILSRMLDENEFLSPYGIRAISAIMPTIPMSSTSADRSTGWCAGRSAKSKGESPQQEKE